ncbi:MAG: Mur ligase family protein [Kiritimatiellia bacterium]
MKRSLVIGYGRSGKSAEAVLTRRGDAVTVIDGQDLVVVSPGVRVMSELEFGVRELRARGVKLFAVTGSKGKSSVVKIVADALTLSGATAVPCGNYGLPVCEVVRRDPLPDWAVVEVSSFQLETTNLPPDAFAAAVVLNLQEDHLDRHGCAAVYHGLKRRLLTMTPHPIAADAPYPDDADELLAGSYFDNPVLRANGARAIELMRAAGLADPVIRRAFATFEPLPHRMNRIGEFGGIRCIDDSKATSLAALAAGVAMTTGAVRLIAGGLPKGDDPNSVGELLTKRVKKVYLIGQSAEAFAEAWKSTVECEICGTMERAVQTAMREAVSGETLLLSPGAASFDQFRNFGERGDVFAGLVKKEGQHK